MFGPIDKLLHMGLRRVMLIPSCHGRLARLWQPATGVLPAEQEPNWPSESAGANDNSLDEGLRLYKFNVPIDGYRYDCECWLPVASEGTFDWFVQGIMECHHAALKEHYAEDAHS